MKTLKRRPKSGFVLYPKEIEDRIIEGTARFRTRCDMIVGPCACGNVHQEHDNWVQEFLEYHNFSIEPLIIYPEEDGTVKIPRYWLKPIHRHSCTVLKGHCACGRTHTLNVAGIRKLLEQHNTVIFGYEPSSAPPPEDKSQDAAVSRPFCNCPVCQEVNERLSSRQHSERLRRLDRRNI